MREIYLDNAATTQMDPEVLRAMMPYMSENYGNPSSPHAIGKKARQAVEEAREKVARFMSCNPEDVIFTSGGSEANSLAIRGFRVPGRKLYTRLEHKSVIDAMIDSNGEEWPALYNGTIDLDGLEDYMWDKDIKFVTAMYVNNELGSVNSVEYLGILSERTGCWFHTDCVQAAGSIKLDVKQIECDSMSISAHKIHGPKGVGALYVRNKSLFNPIIFGSQEHGLRGGTENVAGIVGFGKACEIAEEEIFKAPTRYRELKREFYYKLSTKIEKAAGPGILTVNGAHSHESKIISISFRGMDAQTLLMLMNSNGVYASAGSACTSNEMHASHVLKAIGMPDEKAYSTIRFSFSKYTTDEDIDIATDVIAKNVAMLLSRKR